MTIQRKYESYKIVVTYDDNSKEEINYKGINTSNYKEMISLYQEVKDQYSDKATTVEFVGTNSDGTMKIFWDKKFEGKTEESEPGELKNKTSVELIDYIVESINLLKERQDVAPIRLGSANKERDYQLHRLETLKRKKFNSEEEKSLEYIDIAKKLEEAGDKRRNAKDELELLKDLFGNTQPSQLRDRLDSKRRKFVEYLEKVDEYEYLTEEKAEEHKIIKKVKYTSEKERIKIMTDNDKTREYKRYFIDEDNKEITFYNKAKQRIV